MNLGPTRYGARVAVRQARRRRARTALVVALIALPVAAIVVTTSLLRTIVPTPAQEREWRAGGADAVYAGAVHGETAGRVSAALISALPPGGRAVVVRTGVVAVRRGTAVARVPTLARPMDPLLEGTLLVSRGRLAQRPGEIALSQPVADLLGIGIGALVERGNARVRVVGFIALPRKLDGPVAQVTPAALDAAEVQSVRVFVSGASPATVPLQLTLEIDDSPAERVPPIAPVYLLGGVVLLVGAIVAATAFAVGTRRHLRDLGLLASNGATPGQLAWVQSVEGLVLGAVAAIVGVLVGAAVVLAVGNRTAELVNHLTGPVRLTAADLLAAAGLGVAAAGCAAWVPARMTFALPTLSALAGRRPAGRVPPQVSYAGAALLGLGALLLLWVASLEFGADLWSFSLTGVTLVVLGTVLLTVRIVGAMEVLARRGRGDTRLALRSLGRGRGRSAAVVAAVMAAGALVVGGSTVLLADDAARAKRKSQVVADDSVLVGSPGDFTIGYLTDAVPVDPAAVEALAAVLPGARRFARQGVRPAITTAGTATSPGPSVVYVRFGRVVAQRGGLGSVGTFGGLRVLTPDVARLFPTKPTDGDQPIPPAPFVARIVVAAREDAGAFAAEVLSLSKAGPSRAHLVEAAVWGTPRRDLWGSAFVVSSQLPALGLEPRPAGTVLEMPQRLTAGERAAVDRVARILRVSDPGVEVTMHRPVATSDRLRMGVTVAGLLFVLGVVLLGLALMAEESRVEQTLLAAVGATRASLARIRAVQAGALAGLGGALAVPVGFGAAVAILSRSDDGVVTFPGLAAAVVGLGIPLVVAAVATMPVLLRRTLPVSAALLASDD